VANALLRYNDEVIFNNADNWGVLSESELPMDQHLWRKQARCVPVMLVLLCILLLLTGCSGATGTASGSRPTLAKQQVLNFPNIGITDLSRLDPAQKPDANSVLAVNMIYSGLVRDDKNFQVIPDQATWKVSDDRKAYTFTLLPNVKFSDGTPVTAQTYVYTWTRALLPSVASPNASFLESNIMGADDVSSGKTKTLAGVKAVNDRTLQVSLTQPTAYFLQEPTNCLFFPLNQHVIEKYGEKKWTRQVAGNGVGTGPFMVKQWDHNDKMVFAPNPYYYGNKTRLTAVNMLFANSPSTAFKVYRAGQSDLVWNLALADQAVAKSMHGFTRTSLFQTDLLFFDTTAAPFDKAAVRQAFAYATEKQSLAYAIFKGTITPAPTIIPPGTPGYQQHYAGLGFDAKKAKTLLHSAYPDISQMPPITFSYPNSLMTADEAAGLQQMWQEVLGIQVKATPVQLAAYNDEMEQHQIQSGFIQWGTKFPDPYDWLTVNLLSTASNNVGQWDNAQFDQTVMQAEMLTGDARMALYNQAEQIAISDVGVLPLGHETMAAVIPPWVHGVTLNGNGLYFGDWSDVYIVQH